MSWIYNKSFSHRNPSCFILGKVTKWKHDDESERLPHRVKRKRQSCHKKFPLNAMILQLEELLKRVVSSRTRFSTKFQHADEEVDVSHFTIFPLETDDDLHFMIFFMLLPLSFSLQFIKRQAVSCRINKTLKFFLPSLAKQQKN